MPICNIDNFTQQIKKPQSRLIALDVGKKTIGIATSDPGKKLASPHSILWRSKFTLDMKKLFHLIDNENNIRGVVIGWPLNMDGDTGPRCDSVRDFTHAMLKLRDMPVLLHDERLSTVAADQIMYEVNLSYNKRQNKRDALAAAWILQSALDAINS